MQTKQRYALHIGVGELDKDHYGKRRLFYASTPVANYMEQLFAPLGFDKNEKLIEKDANSKELIYRLHQYKQTLTKGDLLVVSFSGHSYRILNNEIFQNITNKENEDEGWGLYDRVIFHFELWQLIQGFDPGVQIVIFSDTCYSGFMEPRDLERKLIPPKKLPYYLDTNLELYNGILNRSGKPKLKEVQPSVAILSASGEDEKASELRGRTFFSHALNAAVEKTSLSSSLIELYNELSWQIFLLNLEEGMLDISEEEMTASILFGQFEKIKRKQTPHWHYHQGFTPMNLSSKREIFTSKNRHKDLTIKNQVMAEFDITIEWDSSDYLVVKIANPYGTLIKVGSQNVETSGELICKVYVKRQGTENSDPLVFTGTETRVYKDPTGKPLKVICIEKTSSGNNERKSRRSATTVKSGGGGEAK